MLLDLDEFIYINLSACIFFVLFNWIFFPFVRANSRKKFHNEVAPRVLVALPFN